MVKLKINYLLLNLSLLVTLNAFAEDVQNFEDLIASSKDSKEKQKKAQENVDQFNFGKGQGVSGIVNMNYADDQVESLNILKLNSDIPNSFKSDEAGKIYLARGFTNINNECCNNASAATCFPTLKCLKNFTEGDGLENAGCDRKWYGVRRGADACDHLKKVIGEYEKGLKDKIEVQEKIVADEIKAQEALKKKVDDFIKKETQDDPLSFAAMTGEIALLKMADEKEFSDIKKEGTVGKKLASSLEGSILSEYLTKKVREKLGIGIDRYSPPVSDLLNMCDNLETNGKLCGDLSSDVVDYQPVVEESTDDVSGGGMIINPSNAQ